MEILVRRGEIQVQDLDGLQKPGIFYESTKAK